MKNDHGRKIITVDALWTADDLELFRGKPEVCFFSAHDHYINFNVKNHNRLLMIADSQAMPGPSTIAINEKAFNRISELSSGYIKGFLENEQVVLEYNQIIVIINRRSGIKKSFAPACPGKININNHRLTAGYYRAHIEKRVNEFQASPALVLLDLPGGETYFRKAVSKCYPAIIEALLKNNAGAFIESAAELAGLGRGFSPSGDDLIYSSLLAHNYYKNDLAMMNQIRNNIGILIKQTNVMGSHMLALGTMGLAGENILDYITSFEKGFVKKDLIERVLSVGSTTGLDIAIGIIYYINLLFKL